MGHNQQGNSNTGEKLVVDTGDIEQRLVPDEVAPCRMVNMARWVKSDQIHTKRIAQAHIQDTALNWRRELLLGDIERSAEADILRRE